MSNYRFIFAVIERAPVTGCYDARTHERVRVGEMDDRPMSTAYYERVRDGRVLETSELTVHLNMIACPRVHCHA